MTPNRVLGLILATTMGLSPSVGSAEGITGFQDFQFGMSLSDVQAIANLIPKGRDHEAQWYSPSQMVTILGDDYNQTLVFNNEETLTKVELSRTFSGDRFACTNAFDKVYGAIRARYGEPDQPPEKRSDGMGLNTAHFTKSDGSKVSLQSRSLPTPSCYIIAIYVSAPAGSGF